MRYLARSIADAADYIIAISLWYIVDDRLASTLSAPGVGNIPLGVAIIVAVALKLITRDNNHLVEPAP